MRALRFSDAAPGWLLLVLALSAAAYSTFAVSPDPLGPTEVTYRLQAESLARDGDLEYGERDRSRFAEREWPHREAKVLISSERGALRYYQPLPYAIALAPFALLAPERGPYLLNLPFLTALALALCVRVSRDSPRSAPYWAVALLFGTPVFAYVRAVWPELFVGVLLAAAYWLTGDQAPPEELPQMAQKKRNQVAATIRWFGVGALAALAVIQAPVYAACFVVFLVLAVRARADAAWAPSVGGFALVLLSFWFLGSSLFAGGAPWEADTGLAVRAGDSIEEITKWTERLESTSAPGLVFDYRLWLWNAVYSLGGRHVGMAAAFLPLVLFAATGRWRRGLLWAAAGGAALLALVLDPFNFFGGPEALSNRRMVPVLILCFFAVRAAFSAWPGFLAGALGIAIVFPLWADLGGHPRSLNANAVAAPVASVLPFESSQRYIPTPGEAVSRLLLIRLTDDGIEPGSGETQFVLRGGKKGSLMIAAADRLAYLDLEFGASAGTELELEGGVVQDLLFRPEGGVTFRLSLGDALIRHRVWGRDGLHRVHMLEFSMPAEGRRDQPFSVSARAGGGS
ncbi:MAG: hypothetical protein GY769_18090 [bacterium]|nr:hypothetical protein [bacterium]